MSVTPTPSAVSTYSRATNYARMIPPVALTAFLIAALIYAIIHERAMLAIGSGAAIPLALHYLYQSYTVRHLKGFESNNQSFAQSNKQLTTQVTSLQQANNTLRDQMQRQQQDHDRVITDHRKEIQGLTDVRTDLTAQVTQFKELSDEHAERLEQVGINLEKAIKPLPQAITLLNQSAEKLGDASAKSTLGLTQMEEGLKKLNETGATIVDSSALLAEAVPLMTTLATTSKENVVATQHELLKLSGVREHLTAEIVDLKGTAQNLRAEATRVEKANKKREELLTHSPPGFGGGGAGGGIRSGLGHPKRGSRGAILLEAGQ